MRRHYYPVELPIRVFSTTADTVNEFTEFSKLYKINEV